MRLACSLFDRRGNVSDIREITTATILRFKDETLSVANAYTYNGYLAYIKIAFAGVKRNMGSTLTKFINLRNL